MLLLPPFRPFSCFPSLCKGFSDCHRVCCCRSQSFRHASPLHASTGGVGTSLSVHPLLPVGDNVIGNSLTRTPAAPARYCYVIRLIIVSLALSQWQTIRCRADRWPPFQTRVPGAYRRPSGRKRWMFTIRGNRDRLADIGLMSTWKGRWKSSRLSPPTTPRRLPARSTTLPITTSRRRHPGSSTRCPGQAGRQLCRRLQQVRTKVHVLVPV